MASGWAAAALQVESPKMVFLALVDRTIVQSGQRAVAVGWLGCTATCCTYGERWGQAGLWGDMVQHIGTTGRSTASYLRVNKWWLKATESKLENYLGGPFQMKCASYLLFYSLVLGVCKGNLVLRRWAAGGRCLCEEGPVSAPIHPAIHKTPACWGGGSE